MNILKLIFSLGLIFSSAGNISAQELKPVEWEFKTVEEASGLVALHMIATMDEGWHVYATYLPSDEGPIATSIEIEESEEYELVGDLQYPAPITEYDANFMMEVNYYDEEVMFKRYMKPNGTGISEVKGTLEFMCCNDEMCLPPSTVPILVELK